MPDDLSPRDVEELEFVVNFQATAKLDYDQYTYLVACMGDWCSSHPADDKAATILRTIQFTRTR